MPSHHQSAAASRKETPECSRASDRFPWLLLRFLPHSCHHLGIPLPIFTLLQFRNYSSSMSIFFVSLLLSVRLYRSLRQIQQEQGVPVVLYGMAHLTFANSNQWGVRSVSYTHLRAHETVLEVFGSRFRHHWLLASMSMLPFAPVFFWRHGTSVPVSTSCFVDCPSSLCFKVIRCSNSMCAWFVLSMTV